jgi:hypothetical protein
VKKELQAKMKQILEDNKNIININSEEEIVSDIINEEETSSEELK